jgi:hypothetical protein
MAPLLASRTSVAAVDELFSLWLLTVEDTYDVYIIRTFPPDIL